MQKDDGIDEDGNLPEGEEEEPMEGDAELIVEDAAALLSQRESLGGDDESPAGEMSEEECMDSEQNGADGEGPQIDEDDEQAELDGDKTDVEGGGPNKKVEVVDSNSDMEEEAGEVESEPMDFEDNVNSVKKTPWEAWRDKGVRPKRPLGDTPVKVKKEPSVGLKRLTASEDFSNLMQARPKTKPEKPEDR
jgi:hypothetical protein